MVRFPIKEAPKGTRLIHAPLIGNAGAGKTTLINKICGTNFKAEDAVGGVTQFYDEVLGECNYGALRLVDTPGDNGSEVPDRDGYFIFQALSKVPLNTIFFVTPFHPRANQILNQITNLYGALKNHRDKIVFVISHFDIAKDKQKSFNQICKLFEDNQIDNNILFVSQECHKLDISDRMFEVASNMPLVSLDINKDEFMYGLNLAPLNFEMKLDYKEFEKRLIKLRDDYYTVSEIPPKSVELGDLDEFYHMLLVELKNDTQIFEDEFKRIHEGTMRENDVFFLYIQLRKDAAKIYREFHEKIIKKMSYDILNTNDNRYYQCPNCNLLWCKVVGCPITTCGEGFQSDKEKTDLPIKPKWMFSLNKVDGVFMIPDGQQTDLYRKMNYHEEKKFAQPKAKEKIMFNPTLGYHINEKTKRIGCGAPLDLRHVKNFSNFQLFQYLAALDESKSIELYNQELVKNVMTNKEAKYNQEFENYQKIQMEQGR